jgi:DNA topoisomerase VI subunit A
MEITFQKKFAHWKAELEMIERNHRKVELEALNLFGYDFLPRWIAQSIHHRDWLD